jgi:hypothetical protein
MKNLFRLACFLFPIIISGTSCQSSTQSNIQKDEWISLFNGTDIEDWFVKIHHHETGDNYGNTFRVADSTIQVRYDQYEEFNERYGHLYYKTPYSSYHLKLDYQFTGDWRTDAPDYTQLNSGVMYHSQDPHTMPREQDWPISVEMQFLASLGDGNPRPTGNMCSPGTHIVYNGELDTRHCINSSSKTYDAGEWVNAELIVLGSEAVVHIINGDTVLKYTGPQVGGPVVNRFDPNQKPDGKLLEKGFIALQSEGQPINFKNIKLLNLEGCQNTDSPYYEKYYQKIK